MRISENGLSLIKKYEGCRLTAYKPVAEEKYYTIGYGHYGPDVRQGMTITNAQAEAYLRLDCGTAENAVSKWDSVYHWNQNQFDALVSFTYNCGAGNLNKLVNDGKRTIAEIGSKMLSYNKASGRVLSGLTKRRTEEQKLFLTPVTTIGPVEVPHAGAEQEEKKTIDYVVGKTYRTNVDLNVRVSPNGKKKLYKELTISGKLHSRKAYDGSGVLKSGTKVTCKEVRKTTKSTWIRIPSGWICAITVGGKVYVE